MSMSELCHFLRNWFDRDSYGAQLPSWSGEIAIADGRLDGFDERLVAGQYYRITDSVLNDGVWCYDVDRLQDETFDGTVQSMRVPPELEKLCGEIEKWREDHAEALDSPYQSESFGGYSYSLKAGSDAGGGGTTWQSQFSARLAPWRKI